MVQFTQRFRIEEFAFGAPCVRRATSAFGCVHTHYQDDLDPIRGVSLLVDFETTRGMVVAYSVVLLFGTAGGTETIRVYDSTHEFNEMHRYTRAEGKQEGKRFHSGTLGEGLRAAIEDVKRGHLKMIDGWRDG